MGIGVLPVQHESQGRVEHEVAQRFGHYAEGGLALGASNTGNLEGKRLRYQDLIAGGAAYPEIAR